MKKGIALLVLIGMASCGQSTWTEEDRSQFMKQCTSSALAVDSEITEEGAERYCSCTLEKVMEECDNLEETKNVTVEQSQQMAEDCLHELGL